MSLDVYLKGKEAPSNEHFNMYELRHLATNFAISCMHDPKLSFDTFFRGISSRWRDIANRDNPEYDDTPLYLFDANITHNLGTMAKEAGIYEALWRPGEIGATKAADIIDVVFVGYNDMRLNPDKYKVFDSPNGWGTYDDFLPWIKDYLDALKKYPDAKIEVSR